MTEIEITRSISALSGDAQDFADEVKNSQVRSGRDYPYVYVVTIDGRQFIGFASGLPERREPWRVGFLPFNRDTVFNAELEEVEGEVADLVNHLIQKTQTEVGEAVSGQLVTDGGDPDSEGLGDLFG